MRTAKLQSPAIVSARSRPIAKWSWLLLPALLATSLWLAWGVVVNATDAAQSRHLSSAAALSAAEPTAQASMPLPSRAIGSANLALAPEGASLTAQTVITSQPSTCMAIDGDSTTVKVAASKMLFVWSGTPSAAYLILTSCGVKPNKNHTVYLNGQPVAQVDDDPYSTCLCSADGQWGQGGQTQVYPLANPGLVVSGWNYISVTNDHDLSDDWVAHNGRLVLQGQVTGAEISSFEFVSSYDGSTRLGKYQVPIGYDPAISVPLLVSVGGTNEDKRWDDIYRFAKQASERGWILLGPNLRNEFEPVGGRTASLANQHDIIDGINYLKSHFNIDPRRIYMSGFSTGGGIAATVAAKYPHVFAAVVDWAGPTDLPEWKQQLASLMQRDFPGVCPPQGPGQCPMEWARRSARAMSENLKYVPLAIVHGRADTAVPFEQSEKLYLKMSEYFDPEANNKIVVWHDGGHVDWLPTFDGLEWMSGFTLNANPPDIMIRSDEDKDYYWIRVHQRLWNGNGPEQGGWSAVLASHDLETGTISATVKDQRYFLEGFLPLDVSFDVGAMGLDPYARFTVEDYNAATGEFVLHRDVLPVTVGITVALERDATSNVYHQYMIYPGPAPELVEVTLQQRVSPSAQYDGVRDTYIYQYAPTLNYGTDSTLAVNYGRSMRSLFKFDLSPIPLQAVVKEAYLVLYLNPLSGASAIQVGLYPLLANWVDTQATWNLAASGRPWAAPGAQGSGTDYIATAIDERTLYLNSICTFNVRPLVSDWLTRSLVNEGMVLLGPDVGSGSARYRFSSSEATPTNLRPKLVISYMVPVPAPTPTPTATPVACAMHGRVTLQGRAAAPDPGWVVPLTLTLGSTSYSVTTDAWGQFTLSGLTPGTYDLRIKHSHTLSNLKSDVSLLPGGANEVDFGTLLEGDANNDDCVDIRDFYVLKETFNTTDPRADFNQDGIINIYDYYPIKWQFNRCGEASPSLGQRDKVDE